MNVISFIECFRSTIVTALWEKLRIPSIVKVNSLSVVMAGMTAMTGTGYFIDLKSKILYRTILRIFCVSIS